MGNTHFWMASRWRAALPHEQVPHGCDSLDQQGTAANVRACLERAQGSDGDGWILIETSSAVVTRADEQWSVFGDYPRLFAVGDCNCGCVETPVKKPDDWAIPPIPKIEREDSTILPQELIARHRHHSISPALLLKRRCFRTGVSSSQLRPRCLRD